MKILTINGSPNADGNTARALAHVAGPLRALGIEVEAVHIGRAVMPCQACFSCMKRRDGACAIGDDAVNPIYEKLLASGGAVFGTPVYYGGIAGGMKCFLDRLFFLDSANRNALAYKVAAPVAVTRRGGGLTAVDGLLHYFTAGGLVVPGTVSFPVAFGRLPGEVEEDGEGVQALETLGRNIGWLLRGLSTERPERERPVKTNFIR